jgi:hypothetical protein
MPRYIIRDITNAVVNRIIAEAAEVGAFVEEGGSFEMEAEADFTDDRLARFAAADARRYLADTDWFVTRWLETGTPIPEEVSAARAAAREAATRRD